MKARIPMRNYQNTLKNIKEEQRMQNIQSESQRACIFKTR